jgi:hypothetical protein
VFQGIDIDTLELWFSNNQNDYWVRYDADTTFRRAVLTSYPTLSFTRSPHANWPRSGGTTAYRREPSSTRPTSSSSTNAKSTGMYSLVVALLFDNRSAGAIIGAQW